MRTFLYFFLGVFLISCDGGTKVLPQSTGSAGEIIVVIPDALWEKYPGETIKSIFAKNYPGLQQVEPFFNIIRIKPPDFTTIFKTHQNIILVAENQEEGIKNNLWASPQIVEGMSWNSVSDKNKFSEKCENFLEVFYQNLLQKESRKIVKINQSIKKNFDVEVKIPSEYTIINNDSTLFWATHNPKRSDLIKQILVFATKENEINFQDNLIKKVDSVLAKTLKGTDENNFVQIEKRFPIEIKDNVYRGLWKMENEFMGGPFLMKIYRKEDGIVAISIGIVFAPGEAKKRFMIEMDALL